MDEEKRDDIVEKLNEEIRKAKLDGEVKVALAKMGAINVQLAAKAINFEKLDFTEDGVVTGLDDQLLSLSKSDPYLFEANEKQVVKRDVVVDSDDMTDEEYYRTRLKNKRV